MEISNLRAGRTRRHALWIGTSVLVALSLAGVSARPALRLRAAERELADAEARFARREAALASLSRYEAGSGPARTRAALARLRGLVPAPLPELELHGCLRLLAQRHGVELETLDLAPPRDAGLERIGDVVALREARFQGRSSLVGLVRMLAALRALERPLAVLEFHLSHAKAGAPAEWTLVLALFESVPPSAFPEEGASSARENR
jgi:hypothetical protein